MKLLALGLAFAVWVAVTGESRIVLDFIVPVDIAMRPDFILAGTPPTTVAVRLRGPETLLRRPGLLGLELHADLRDASTGERNVQLSAANLSGVPRGVVVDRITPDRLTLILDRKLRRTLPVVPSLVGQPPKGSAFYGVEIIPDSVEVEGPLSRLGSITRLRTDPIHLENRTSSFVEHVSAVPDTPEVTVLHAGPLELRVQVGPAPVVTTFENVPVVLAGQVYEAKAPLPMLRVTLAGPAFLLEKIRATQIRAVVDVSGLESQAAPYRLPVRLEFVDVPPEDLGKIVVKSVKPDKVEVRLSGRRIAS